MCVCSVSAGHQHGAGERGVIWSNNWWKYWAIICVGDTPPPPPPAPARTWAAQLSSKCRVEGCSELTSSELWALPPVRGAGLVSILNWGEAARGCSHQIRRQILITPFLYIPDLIFQRFLVFSYDRPRTIHRHLAFQGWCDENNEASQAESLQRAMSCSRFETIIRNNNIDILQLSQSCSSPQKSSMRSFSR